MWKVAPVTITDGQWDELERRVRAHTSTQRAAKRARKREPKQERRMLKQVQPFQLTRLSPRGLTGNGGAPRVMSTSSCRGTASSAMKDLWSVV